jgi:hypothetical protein
MDDTSRLDDGTAEARARSWLSKLLAEGGDESDQECPDESEGDA